MNNGRMTFRFDEDKDKPWPKDGEHRSGSGLATASEYKAEALKQEEDEHGWIYEAEPLTLRGTEPKPSYKTEPMPPYKYASNTVDPRWIDSDELEDDKDRRQDRQTFFRSDTPPNLWDYRQPSQPPMEKEENWDAEWNADRDLNRTADRTPFGYDPKPDSETFEYGGKAGGGFGGGAYHSRRPSYWWKFALSIAGALGTGLLLGYTALSFFGGGLPGGGSSAAVIGNAAVQGQNSGAAADPAGAGTSGLPLGETGNVKTIPVSIAAQSYYLLQYGVFRSADGASQAQQELLGAGLAAGLDPDDGNRVYAGLSPDREQAKLLSGGLKNQGIELYVRELVLPSEERLAFAESAETAESYFTASGKLLGGLSSLSAGLLSTGQADASGAVAVSDLHLQWKEAAKALEQSLPPELQSLCASLEKSMSQGISALGEYNKSKANGLLWEVQGSMMDFLTGQKRLLAAMAGGQF